MSIDSQISFMGRSKAKNGQKQKKNQQQKNVKSKNGDLSLPASDKMSIDSQISFMGR